MRVSSAGLPEAFGYFAWALENLPAVSGIAESLARDSDEPLDELDDAVRRSFLIETRQLPETFDRFPERGRWWSAWQPRWNLPEEPDLPRPTDYVDTVGAVPSRYLSAPEQYFGADSQSLGPMADAAAYRLMLNCFLMAFGEERSCLPWLGVLMLRGPLDRQFTIARFLHLMTNADGVDVGRYDSPPSRGLVLDWASAITRERVSFRGFSLERAVGAYRAALRRTDRWEG
ncbi:hypothetical protein BN159_0065 [Streptomyces davaonensis JCM 4913]|uniref:Uncharacterized protein n=1 Tax=Streptomyces davaonensis (strain DSM 101723 / JCM 4913 / KCC S-0913 / 768) TaxID=1214101 RepID=K4QVP1_STRDJ|nr:hypothetical protein [Streptomyces davaonensis]CCK24444.1 hypothetical protein BN159_0065 [Streptomyces davaonensis JCM 4913]